MTGTISYHALRSPVENQGVPPASFLDELILWARTAPDDIFAPNNEPDDIMPRLKRYLASAHVASGGVALYWRDLTQRKCALLELMRVHAGFESGWNWNEGVDRTNKRSQQDKEREETGIFQVSYDSLYLDKYGELTDCLVLHLGVSPEPQQFIDAMKQDHKLALEYYARLVRISYKWAGPLIREKGDSVYGWLRRNACEEFEANLTI